jgi:hypothetical protein
MASAAATTATPILNGIVYGKEINELFGRRFRDIPERSPIFRHDYFMVPRNTLMILSRIHTSGIRIPLDFDESKIRRAFYLENMGKIIYEDVRVFRDSHQFYSIETLNQVIEHYGQGDKDFVLLHLGKCDDFGYDTSIIHSVLDGIFGSSDWKYEDMNRLFKSVHFVGRQHISSSGIRRVETPITDASICETDKKRLNTFFSHLENQLYPADDDYAFADCYYYGANWFMINILYIFYKYKDMIRVPRIQEMLSRIPEHFERFETFLRTNRAAPEIPELVQRAIRLRGIDALFMYSREIAPHVHVKYYE